jgi:hypothetical protein
MRALAEWFLSIFLSAVLFSSLFCSSLIRGATAVLSRVCASPGIESFYRSGLNAAMNARLSGHWGKLFPNMHIQARAPGADTCHECCNSIVADDIPAPTGLWGKQELLFVAPYRFYVEQCPARIMYINGFKGLRQYLDMTVKPEDYSNPTAVRVALSFAPGIIMTPLSSILESSNAGHMNPEPITKRWLRGTAWRMAREIIFGIGLNQMSDYFEERIPNSVAESEALRTALGSCVAGVLSGYFSHIPHNLSTLKLMTPSLTYGQHLGKLIDQSESRVPTSLSPTTRRAVASAAAILFPRAVVIRTCQIVGSFIILNGTINALKYAELPTSIPTAF